MEKYDYEIAFVDLWVKSCSPPLDERGWRKDTAMVVMADHGEAWGEHKAYFHGQDLFDEQLRVPLIIAVPGQKPRVIAEDAVSLVDVGADAARSGRGAHPGRHARAQPAAAGRGRRAAGAAAPHLRRADAGHRLAPPRAMMVDGGHKLIHRISDRRWELYDLRERSRREAQPGRRAGGSRRRWRRCARSWSPSKNAPGKGPRASRGVVVDVDVDVVVVWS